MLRYDIINYLADKYKYKSYLEIGVRNPKDCFDKVNIEHKTAVDPKFYHRPFGKNVISHEVTSDDFFSTNDKCYDIVFIDGMHVYEYVYRDIQNSLKILNSNGYIVLHDCNPLLEYHQRPFEQYNGSGVWNGTVWKAFVKCRTNKNLSMLTINIDHGIGCIKEGQQKTIDISDDDLIWENFNKNRDTWLNLHQLNQETMQCL